MRRMNGEIRPGGVIHPSAHDPASAIEVGSALATDEELVRRFQEGDRSAFDLLFTRYQHKVRCVMLRYLRDPSEVQDVVQEAFVKVLRALPRFRGESTFYTWLYRVAVNTVKNHVIATCRRPPDADVDVEDAQFREGAERLRQGEDPAALVCRDELSAEINRAISALPDDLRSALTLRELDGLSYEQIACVLGCPVGTVRSRIYRARGAIDECIRPLL